MVRAYVTGVAMLLAMTPVGAQTAFLGVVGSDTIVIETVTRTPTRLDLTIVSRTRPGDALSATREVLSLPITAAGLPDGATFAAWAPGASAEGPPQARGSIALSADTAVATIEQAGRALPAQRMRTRVGAVVVPNTSFAVFEVLIGTLRRRGVPQDSVPLLLLAGGRTVMAVFTNLQQDSVSARIGPQAVWFVLDSAGRLRRGGIPSQRLRVERVEGIAVSRLAMARADYRAPAGAPYTATDVRIPTPAGHTLAGTLTLPIGGGSVGDSARAGRRWPLVITITGSSPQDRDEYIEIVPGGYRPFRQLADTLSRRGVAVLRYDDRGFGGSTGDHAAATSADFADDVRAAVAWARTRPEIDSTRILLLGHSEGGMIAPMVAATDPRLAGLVLMAGPGRRGREILEFQIRASILGDTSRTPRARDSLLARAPAVLDSVARSTPWVAFFAAHDPLPVARRVRRTPVLILQGADDQQVIAAEAPRLAAAFRAGGNRQVTTRIFPELNHLFIRQPGGAPGGYATLPTSRLDAAVVGAVVDWVVQRTGAR